MNAEFIAMLDYLERERGIKRDILLEAVSNALSPRRRRASASRAICASISTRRPARFARCEPARRRDGDEPGRRDLDQQGARHSPDAQIGEAVEVEVTPRNFGRIAAQTAKQAMMQRIRQVEKEMIYESSRIARARS
jgi:N utilization substance protein A